MKFFIVALCFVALVVADISDEDKAKWKAFKKLHGKMFLSKNKEEKRMQTYLKNSAKIEDINEKFENGEIFHTAAEYPHHDLTPEEFLERRTGAEKPAVNTARMGPILRGNAPAALDLTTSPEVGPIKDQQQCGSCWTFSTVASSESRYYRNNKKPVVLSEQQLVNCVYNRDGCDGGWMTDGFQYIKTNGITLNSTLKYAGVYGACGKYSPAYYTKTWATVPNTIQSIKNYLNDNGVLAIAVDAGGYGAYKSGVFTCPTTGQVNHAVNLVGYGVCPQTKKAFWKIRNSWGTWWGEQGYIRIAMAADGVAANSYHTEDTFALTS